MSDLIKVKKRGEGRTRYTHKYLPSILLEDGTRGRGGRCPSVNAEGRKTLPSAPERNVTLSAEGNICKGGGRFPVRVGKFL